MIWIRETTPQSICLLIEIYMNKEQSALHTVSRVIGVNRHGEHIITIVQS